MNDAGVLRARVASHKQGMKDVTRSWAAFGIRKKKILQEPGVSGHIPRLPRNLLLDANSAANYTRHALYTRRTYRCGVYVTCDVRGFREKPLSLPQRNPLGVLLRCPGQRPLCRDDFCSPANEVAERPNGQAHLSVEDKYTTGAERYPPL